MSSSNEFEKRNTFLYKENRFGKSAKMYYEDNKKTSKMI
jgi:hypothetical protein